MARGYILVATGKDYIKQAYICAKSIKETQRIDNVSVVTNDEVPLEYKHVFDSIIPLPWVSEQESKSLFLTEQRWKVYHM